MLNLTKPIFNGVTPPAAVLNNWCLVPLQLPNRRTKSDDRNKDYERNLRRSRENQQLIELHSPILCCADEEERFNWPNQTQLVLRECAWRARARSAKRHLYSEQYYPTQLKNLAKELRGSEVAAFCSAGFLRPKDTLEFQFHLTICQRSKCTTVSVWQKSRDDLQKGFFYWI